MKRKAQRVREHLPGEQNICPDSRTRSAGNVFAPVERINSPSRQIHEAPLSLIRPVPDHTVPHPRDERDGDQRQGDRLGNLRGSDNLSDWLPLGGPIPGTGFEESVTDPAAGLRRYYRVDRSP
jgi:hypothetical protein